MPNNVQTRPGPNLSGLVGDIIKDAQLLIRQEIMLARSELLQEGAKIKMAVLSLAAGGVVVLVGALLLAFGLVHLLHWAAGAIDLAVVPLWAWFLIVGGIVALSGGALLFRGAQKAREVQVPPPQTMDSLKEIL